MSASSTHLRLHHLCIFAEDVDRSIGFYSQAFGAEITSEWNEVIDDTGQCFPGRGVFMRLSANSFIEIFPADPGAPAPDFPVRAYNHMCFASLDCNADYARALAAGADPYAPARAREKGVDWDGTPKTMILADARRSLIRIAYLKGPDGEIIELIETDSPLLGGSKTTGKEMR